MTDWNALTARAGTAGHDLVGWMMWDPRALEYYEALGVTQPRSWVVAWRIATLGPVPAEVAAATCFSIHPAVIEFVMASYRGHTTEAAILDARDRAVLPGLAEVDPALAPALGELADDLWRGVDSVHFGARPLFAAHRARPRPADLDPGLSAWLAANCLRELRGDNHWALCTSEDLDDVEVGLLHSAMVDVEEYGSEEWIARSRGNDDAAIARGWARLEAKGFASGGALNDTGRAFRLDLEARTNALTEPAWREIGEEATAAFCELIEPHHDAFVARIDATAGPRWMPAVRSKPAG